MTKCKYWKKGKKKCSLKNRFLNIYGDCAGTGKIKVWDEQALTAAENCSFKRIE
jgi:hypothetical protein